MKPRFKLRIILNDEYWKTMPEKIAAIKAFFKPVCEFDIKIEYSHLLVPLVQDPAVYPLYLVDRIWYDRNISVRDDDIVMFIVPSSSKGSEVTPAAVMTGRDIGAWEITMFSEQNHRAYIQGVDYGDMFTLFANHELSHVLYQMLGKTDRTHEHFYAGNPDKVLEDFANLSDQITNRKKDLMQRLLLKLNEYLLALLGQKAIISSQIIDMDPKTMPARLKLWETAQSCIGIDASPRDVAPDELGCAETVNEIHKKAFGVAIGGDLSTYRMYRALNASDNHMMVDSPLKGDIIISPTGYGNGRLPNGHCGIVGEEGDVYSNDSKTGKFIRNFTIESWKDYYGNKGGYPVVFFRVEGFNK